MPIGIPARQAGSQILRQGLSEDFLREAAIGENHTGQQS